LNISSIYQIFLWATIWLQAKLAFSFFQKLETEVII
jgi:hypothetical protein